MSGDEAAFPRLEALSTTGTRYFAESAGGLTKRELVAAMAMQGFCSNWDYLRSLDVRAQKAKTSLEFAIARASVSYADALLAELAKPPASDAERPHPYDGKVCNVPHCRCRE